MEILISNFLTGDKFFCIATSHLHPNATRKAVRKASDLILVEFQSVTATKPECGPKR